MKCAGNETRTRSMYNQGIRYVHDYCHYLYARICAPSKPSLKQLDSHDSKHEEEEERHHQDVPNVLHGGHHALHYVLQASCSVDCSRKQKHELSSDIENKHLTSAVSELV